MEKLDWSRLLFPSRYGEPELATRGDDRSHFAKDIDRIIFSNSFRRLGKKTQVHPLATNDHIHTRLSHSLEVSSVGRSLGTLVGKHLYEKTLLPDGIDAVNVGEIVHAACLAHDIGNPPFGHAGEYAIRNYFSDTNNHRYTEKLAVREKCDFINFDGNAQGFRIVNRLEHHINAGGMRLTYPTIATMVKYPVSSYSAQGSGRSKFSFYKFETEYFHTIWKKLGLLMGSYSVRHPLSYLMEAADDICYRIIDLEDARELKLVTLEDIHQALSPMFTLMSFKSFPEEFDAQSDRRKASYLRAKLINALIQEVYNSFIEHLPSIENGTLKGDLIGLCTEPTQQYFKMAADLAQRKIFKDPKKISLEIGSYSLYKRLLDVLIPAVYDFITNEEASYKSDRALALLGVNCPQKSDKLYEAYLKVIDFVSGMTDNYATFISEQFSGTGR